MVAGQILGLNLAAGSAEARHSPVQAVVPATMPETTMMPADVYFGRAEEAKDKREAIKQKTMKQRRQLNRQMAPNILSLEWRIFS